MNSSATILFFLVFICSCLLPSKCSAWSIWPFTTTSASNQPSLPSSKNKGEPKRTPQRPNQFQAPFEITKKLLSLQENDESNCRYELAKRLVQETETCSSGTSLRHFARIATVCHYSMSDRADRLPPTCNNIDDRCLSAMSQEAFQVYTAFHLHAEKICKLRLTFYMISYYY